MHGSIRDRRSILGTQIALYDTSGTAAGPKVSPVRSVVSLVSSVSSVEVRHPCTT
jgi:hypothetical protein